MIKTDYIIIKALLYSVLVSITYLKAQVPAKDTPLFFKRTSYLSDNLKTDSLGILVDSVVKKYMQNSEYCGISIGVSKDGKNYFYNYGESKRGSGNLPENNTIYEIGAISTTFCGILLAKALEEKKLKAEDDIRLYLPTKFPGLQFNQSPILVKHLANHSSGLPSVPENLKTQNNYSPLNPYAGYTKEMLLSYLSTRTLTQLPGTTNDYSSIGIALLGMVLEHVYALPFEVLVKEKICMPLGMSNTGINLNTEQTKELAGAYNQEGEPTPNWSLGIFEAAGGLKSTSEDLLQFLKFNSEEKKNVSKNTRKNTPPQNSSDGSSWYVSKTKKGNTLFSQSGGTAGYGAFGGFIVEKNCAVIILSNNGVNLEFLGIPILNYLQQ